VLDADVLVRYDHPHFGRWPAVTTRAHGLGRVTMVGTIPDPALARAVLAWAVEQRGSATDEPFGGQADGGPRWRPQAPSQTVTGATNPAGERVRFVHSWSWEPSTFVLPGAVRDVLSGAELAAGTQLELGPWDVRVLLEG
jgi:beta-galactosidase